jgi:phytoene dehydrogenase-like protein
MPVIERRGGKCLIRHRVKRVLIENGAAAGVEVVHRKGGRDITDTYFAPVVISGAGAHTTYAKLIPRELAEPYLDKLNTLLPGNSGVSLYVSFRESPESLGFHGENYWISDSYDHDGDRESESAISGNPIACYLSFPSLKNPKASVHTAEILAITDYGAFKRWGDRPWKDRGEEYDALKEKMGEGLLSLVDRKFPGFRDLVDYQEVSTPLSVEHFMRSPEGAIYGLAGTPERFRQKWLGVRTPVKNLYLAGSDVYFHGLVGATMGGLAAAGAAIGPFGFFRIMTSIMMAARRRK